MPCHLSGHHHCHCQNLTLHPLEWLGWIMEILPLLRVNPLMPDRSLASHRAVSNASEPHPHPHFPARPRLISQTSGTLLFLFLAAELLRSTLSRRRNANAKEYEVRRDQNVETGALGLPLEGAVLARICAMTHYACSSSESEGASTEALFVSVRYIHTYMIHTYVNNGPPRRCTPALLHSGTPALHIFAERVEKRMLALVRSFDMRRPTRRVCRDSVLAIDEIGDSRTTIIMPHTQYGRT